LRTANGTGEAGGTEPGRLGGNDIFFQSQLCQSNNLIGQQIHGEAHGAASRALATLVTGKKVLSRDFGYFLDEVTLERPRGDLNSHSNALSKIQAKPENAFMLSFKVDLEIMQRQFEGGPVTYAIPLPAGKFFIQHIFSF
jgi:hypothetical protein